MISVITCSRTPELPIELQQNIATTIGCEYELVTIDNSQNKYNIFHAYNEGVRRAKGDVLCFCHDDILFHTENWGDQVINTLTDSTIGLLGLFGSHFMSAAPLYWWSSPIISQYSMNTDNGVQELCEHIAFYHGDLADVAVVDGVCFFIRADTFKSIRFDEEHYTGFHVYDMDISMQVQQLGLRVCVTKVLLLEHFWNESSMKNEQYASMLDYNMNIFADKWATHLPILRGLDLPDSFVGRLNNLCIQAYDAVRARHSKTYLLGKFILHPSISNFKRLLHL